MMLVTSGSILGNLHANLTAYSLGVSEAVYPRPLIHPQRKRNL